MACKYLATDISMSPIANESVDPDVRLLGSGREYENPLITILAPTFNGERKSGAFTGRCLEGV